MGILTLAVWFKYRKAETSAWANRMPRWAAPGKAAQKRKGGRAAKGGGAARGSESVRGSKVAKGNDPAGRREAGAKGGFFYVPRPELLGPFFCPCRLRTGRLALRFIGGGWFFAGCGCAIIAWKNQDGQRRRPAQRALAVRARQAVRRVAAGKGSVT